MSIVREIKGGETADIEASRARPKLRKGGTSVNRRTSKIEKNARACMGSGRREVERIEEESVARKGNSNAAYSEGRSQLKVEKNCT